MAIMYGVAGDFVVVVGVIGKIPERALGGANKFVAQRRGIYHSYLPDGDRIAPHDCLSSDVREVHVKDGASQSIHYHLRIVNVVVDMRRLSHDSPLPDL